MSGSDDKLLRTRVTTTLVLRARVLVGEGFALCGRQDGHMHETRDQRGLPPWSCCMLSLRSVAPPRGFQSPVETKQRQRNGSHVETGGGIRRVEDGVSGQQSNRRSGGGLGVRSGPGWVFDKMDKIDRKSVV